MTLTVMISSPGSNQGKTSLTAGLANHFRLQNKMVQVFKVGPDYLDPMVLQVASGNTVYQLDLWMQGDFCKEIFHQKSRDADVVLIEGNMGLFDGNPSCADLAKLLNIPVLLIMSAFGMAESLAAAAHGFYHYDPQVNIEGFIANKISSPKHLSMIQRGFHHPTRFIGGIFKQPEGAIPSRHLGLLQASELHLDETLDYWTQQVRRLNLPDFLKPLNLEHQSKEPLPKLLKDINIAVSRDQAFSFMYTHNVESLIDLGANVKFFSPLNDPLPECDSVYLTGGYPELHLPQLNKNNLLKQQLKQHVQQDKPLLAECGGFLYLLKALDDMPMCDIIPYSARTGNTLNNLGYQSYFSQQQETRGHCFHYTEIPHLQGSEKTTPKEANGKPEVIYHQGNLFASYVHWQFCSNYEQTARWFGKKV